MADIVLALLAIAGGLLFCLRGYASMRVVFAVWGAITGFALGSGLVAAVSGDGMLATGAGWIAGIVGAIALSLLAYLFYAVSVLLAMASTGYLLGASVLVALGVDWSWLVALGGVACGVVLTVAAIALDLPGAIIMVVTATGGAAATVGGLMLLLGTIDAADLTRHGVTRTLADHPAWWIAYAALAIVGIVAQVRSQARLTEAARAAWQQG